MRLNLSSSFVRARLVTLFLMGIVLLTFAIQQVVVMWTPRSSLTPLIGTLEGCDTYVTTVSNKGRYGYVYTSQKAELIFYLHEHRKKFSLVENIGSDFRSERQARINQRLKLADSITVWIKKSESEYWEPKIFQVETDREKLLDFQEVRFKDRPITLFLLLIGLGFVFFPIYLYFPTLFNKQKVNERPPATLL